MSAFRYVPIEALLLAVLVGVAAAAAASAPALVRRDRSAALLRASRVLLLGAVLAAVAVTVLDGAGGDGVNLVPGVGIRESLDNVNSDLGRLNVLGNVLMFMPIGLLLPLATRLRRRGATAACTTLSIAVEVTQLGVGRSADIDDVLLNTLGGAIGAALGVAVAAWLTARAERYTNARAYR